MIGMWSWDEKVGPRPIRPPTGSPGARHAGVARLGRWGGVDRVATISPDRSEQLDHRSRSARGGLGARRSRQVAWNRAAHEAVNAFPGHAIYLTTEQLFAPDGRFLAWMRTAKGTWVRRPQARQRPHVPVRSRGVRRTHHRGLHSATPSPFDEARLGVRILDQRPPVQRPARSLPRRPAPRRVPRRSRSEGHQRAVTP